MFDTYESFVYFMADLAVTARHVSDEKYLAWREECLQRAEEEMENPDFMREIIKLIDKYSGKCVDCSKTGRKAV